MVTVSPQLIELRFEPREIRVAFAKLVAARQLFGLGPFDRIYLDHESIEHLVVALPVTTNRLDRFGLTGFGYVIFCLLEIRIEASAMLAKLSRGLFAGPQEREHSGRVLAF